MSRLTAERRGQTCPRPFRKQWIMSRIGGVTPIKITDLTRTRVYYQPSLISGSTIEGPDSNRLLCTPGYAVHQITTKLSNRKVYQHRLNSCLASMRGSDPHTQFLLSLVFQAYTSKRSKLPFTPRKARSESS